MIFGTRSQISKCKDMAIKHGQIELEHVECFKYLAVKLDPHLRFAEQVQYIKSKTISKISLLRQVSNFLDRNTQLNLYKTLILPIFDYSDYVYNCLT